MSDIKIGVITASDRASKGIYDDISGVAIQDTMKDYLKSEFSIEYRCIPDEQDILESTMKELCDEAGCCLVVTTGEQVRLCVMLHLRLLKMFVRDDAGLWRVDASSKPSICSNCDFITSDCRHSR